MGFTSQIEHLDLADPLREFPSRFFGPPGVTYLVGHSLGLMSDSALSMTQAALKQWRELAVESWFEQPTDSPLGPWLEVEQRARPLLAPFLGATPDDVTITNALGTNLMMVLHSLYRPRGAKRRIAMMSSMFPQDRWLVMNHLRLPGHDPEAIHWIEPLPGERLIKEDDLCTALRSQADQISLLLLESVSYVTGQLFDLERIAKVCQENNITFVVDVAHGAFVCPFEFNRWGVDAAVGCSYKFGCSGPGGVGLLYMNKRHWSDPTTWRPGGWWGNDRATQFLMGPTWQAAQGAAGWQVSTVPVLAAAPFLGALELFAKAGITAIRAKSLAMTALLLEGLDALPGAAETFRIITPRSEAQRASEIMLEFFDKQRAAKCQKAMRTAGVMVDYRESPFAPYPGTNTQPGLVRIGAHPLFNRFEDLAHGVEVLGRYAA